MEEIREHDGYVKGHADGIQEGELSKQRDIAANMLAMDIDIPVIARATGLSESDISKLRQDIPE